MAAISAAAAYTANGRLYVTVSMEDVAAQLSVRHDDLTF